MKVSVSFISSHYNEIETIEQIQKTDADYIHVDLMDGHFVEHKNYTFSEIVKYLGSSKKKLDVHLMTVNPQKYIEEYATLNTEYLTFHYEVVKDHLSIINEIKEYGLKVGMSIKPGTPIREIESLLPHLDQILVMSVEPGAGGQEFLFEVIAKIQELDALKKHHGYKIIISVDGGVRPENIAILKVNHVDMVVSGSFVCKSDNYQDKNHLLKG